MATKTRFTSEERLLLKIGEGFIVKRQRLSHMAVRVTMRHKDGTELEVSDTLLAKLCGKGLLHPVPQDHMWDFIIYEPTDKGHKLLASLWQREGEKRG
jgi:hypothetical protein